jgi:hypothetical protein
MIREAPSNRHRMGVAFLLGWREVYPWVSLQMFPLLAFWWFKGEPAIEWFVPIFVFTSLLTFSAGPAQTWYAWRLAHPSIKQHKRWFVVLGLSSLFFYTEVKNVVGRTAHLKELMRERKWKVTPRSGAVALDAEADHVEQPAATVAPATEPVAPARSVVTGGPATEPSSPAVLSLYDYVQEEPDPVPYDYEREQLPQDRRLQPYEPAFLRHLVPPGRHQPVTLEVDEPVPSA